MTILWVRTFFTKYTESILSTASRKTDQLVINVLPYSPDRVTSKQFLVFKEYYLALYSEFL